ncbi:protein IQ-DOMAIN 14-like [Papaver somniferum]|uniref:protein IQ-DOMAIN 14-like n=1 Tax=Papaver somniferum TaxID=3469 RepID=UPI000E6FD951|nr:protein IQ-DOMAIN 14-like [Papaver somniferum]
MGKKGNWFSAIKKVFSPNSKDKVANELEKNNTGKKKKWGLGKLRNGETTSFIPLYREPSSIEKILGDAEKERQLAQPILSSTDQRRVPSVPSIVAQRYEQINQGNNKNNGSTSSSISNTNTTTVPISTSNTATPRKPNKASSSNSTTSNNTPNTKTNNGSTTTATTKTDNNSSSSRSNNTTTTKNYRIPPTIEQHHIAATKIQSIYRGYMARRSFRALKGLMRLQGVVRGQSVKRQTMNAMKYMQLLVKVQTQIQSRRIHTLENQAQHRSDVHNNDKELENNMARWILTHTAGQENWDDSVLTKEELDARLQRKVDAIIKRERALAYVHSHQSLKASPKSAQSALMEIRSGGFPWWWNWIERQLPENQSEIQSTQLKNNRFSEVQSIQTNGQFSEFQSQQHRTDVTPPRRWSQGTGSTTARPQTGNSKQSSFRLENLDSLTPRPKTPLGSMARTPVHLSSSRSPLSNKPGTPMKHPKPRSVMGGDYPLRDNDSLTSCPPFSVPNYMTPTVSAQAKVRSHSNPKDRLLATPDREQKRRLSFPLTQSIGSMRWGKSPLFSSKDSSSRSVLGKNQPVHSVGNVSVDSTVSLPPHLGRRPFK